MEIEKIICRRVAKVNIGRSPLVHVEAVNESRGGGLHVVIGITSKHRGAAGNLYVPATMRPALEKELPHKCLDELFRL